SHGRGRLQAEPPARGDPGPGGDGHGGRPPARDGVERRGHGHGGAAPQLRGHDGRAARAHGPGGLRGLAEEAHALDRRHPARAREAEDRAGAPEPGHQPARTQPRAAAGAHADRGEVRPRRRDRGGAALSDSPGRPGHLRVRPPPRRERRPRARARARRAPPRLTLQGEPHPAQPGAGDPVRGAAARVGRSLLPDPGRRPPHRVRAPAAGPGHPRGLRPAPPEARRRGARPRGILSVPRLPALLAFAALLLLPGLGASPFERAEIYFMDAARGMAERGDWLVPRYRGEAFFDKPALTYWLMAASFRAFGYSPAAARLVSVLAALGVVAATVWLGTLLFDRRTALTGGFVLASTAAFLSFGRLAMSDMLLSLFSTLAVAITVAALRPGASPALVPALGAVLGLGFLTKGPVALLLPGLAILLVLWSRLRGPLPVRAGASYSRPPSSPQSASAGSWRSPFGSARDRSPTSSSARTSSVSRARRTT